MSPLSNAVMVVVMTDVGAIGENMRESAVSNKDQTMRGETVEIRDWIAEPLTSEKVFNHAVNLLREMGYDCLSEDRIEDFTERIDGIFRKRANFGDRDSSGYLRILTVYRSGKKIHVELYNFLKKFPTDSIEMKEVSESLRRLFEKEPSVYLNVHE